MIEAAIAAETEAAAASMTKATVVAETAAAAADKVEKRQAQLEARLASTPVRAQHEGDEAKTLNE